MRRAPPFPEARLRPPAHTQHQNRISSKVLSMNNSALFNAFTKVRSEVEEAISARRERDEKERLREEKARIEAKREARETERREYLKKAEEVEKELEAERARTERRRNAAKTMSTTADSSEREAPARGGRRDGAAGERGRTNARGRGDGRREPNRDAAGGRNGRGSRGARGARGLSLIHI